MKPERWRQINRIFEQALELPAPNRAAFLAEACGGDSELRREVADMLSADAETAVLIDKPAHEMAKDFFTPPVITAPDSELSSGRMVGSYRLLHEIGRGGMGCVYLAEDLRLGRRVAFKLLPETLTTAPDRVARFQREARAASALNHPNILTIYDFGQEGEQHYIAAEFVEGQTLRAFVGNPSFTLGRILDVATQIAAALTAAHRAGIIHRDIKPENVMLRPDGYVKVLDFGLAKLTEPNSSAAYDNGGRKGPEGIQTNASEAESMFETQSGIVLGTVNYMSPEQARGERVDERTDIFSLGAMLYELLTGRHPFARNSRAETLVAVLERDPPPIAQSRPDVPESLQQIVMRALAKDRSSRHAAADELLAELKRAKQMLDAAEVTGKTSGQARAVTRENAAQTTFSGQSFLNALQERKFGESSLRIGLALALLAGAVVAGFGARQWLGWGNAELKPFEKFAAAKLTYTGNVIGGTISPDGKYLAMMEEETGGTRTLRVRQMVAGGNFLPLVTLNASPRGIAFTPDSNFLYYIVPDPEQTGSNALYRIALLGGQPRKVLTDLGGLRNSSFSPDGKRLVFPRRMKSPDGVALVVADADGSWQQTFATFTDRQNVWGYAWSPDGRTIAYSVRDEARPRGNYYYLAERPLNGGPERMIVPPQSQWIAFLSWLPDGRGLLANTLDDTTGRFQLYHFSYPGGVKRQITHDGNNYTSPVVTADGRTVLMGQTERPSNVWVAPFDDPRRARQFTPGVGNYDRLAWTRDGRLVHDSMLDLWLTMPDGKGARQLTLDSKANLSPAPAPDGRYIVFASRRTGRYEIWRMEMDGGNLVQLSTNGGDHPQCLPDGIGVIYESESEGAANQKQLWKVPLSGGTPERLFEFAASNAAVAPDGQRLACEMDDPATKEHGVGIVALSTGQLLKFFKLTPGAGGLAWTPDGDAILYIDGLSGNHQMKLQPVAGGSPRALLEMPNENLFAAAVSPDGRQIAYTSGRVTTDLILLTEAK